ncbi:MAG: IMP cyclohydrolase [Desulfobacterales bacterium]|nr:IMP cyclohydrolase [Desulfobacterales bacterium]
MTDSLKQMYKTILNDHFSPKMEISFIDGDHRQTLMYEKVEWIVEQEKMGLRYGENPCQEAGFYKLINGNLMLGGIETIHPGRYLVSDAELLQFGKHPGKINITDADNALNILRYFSDKPCVAIIKHNNPCGVAKSDTLEHAYLKAYMSDRVAAFGGCIATNRPIDKPTAEAIAQQYAEVLVAPDFEDHVLDILTKRKNLRIMRIKNIHKLHQYVGQRYVDFKSLMDGGMIVQWSYAPKTLTKDDLIFAECTYQGKTYTIQRHPTEQEYDDLLFGWLVESGITSNSVIYVKHGVTVGIGTGEQDRVGVAEIARDKAYRKLADRYCYERYHVPYHELTDPDKKLDIDHQVNLEKGGLTGSAMVSDAFFPFRDGIDVGIREGITSVIHPGGSLNDYQSIEACNESNVTMVFTGQRSFKH